MDYIFSLRSPVILHPVTILVANIVAVSVVIIPASVLHLVSIQRSLNG